MAKNVLCPEKLSINTCDLSPILIPLSSQMFTFNALITYFPDDKSKQSFPFELLSDPDEKVCKAFDVMKLKSMYGREYIGVDRSTFLISTNGVVLKEWRSVKVKGHVDDVLSSVKNLT